MDDRSKTVLGVMIIEDSRLLRGMLVDVLSSIDGIAVVGEAEDQESGLRLLENRQPDVVIIDLELSGGSGIGVLGALRKNREKFGNTRAVIFTNHGSSILRRRCEYLGIDGFFDKSYQLDDLLDYIQSERDALIN